MENAEDNRSMSFRQFRSDLRESYAIHRTLGSRVLWGMAHYHFGRWVLRMRKGPLRWLCNGLYSFTMTPMTILSGINLDRITVAGKSLHIIHPGMVCIHPRAVIGDNVGIMHNVTIGMGGGRGVPRIGNRVFIGTGAVLLGGITIGDDAKIAANSLVLIDVPPGGMAIGVPAKAYPPALRKPA